MGIYCELEEKFTFIYKAEFDNGLTEHEYDHAFFGSFNGNPNPDSNEVSDWKWISLEELKQDINNNPERYSAWLKVCLDKVIKTLEQS